MDVDRQDYGNISLFDIKQQGVGFWTRTDGWTAAQTTLRAFLCPSESEHSSAKNLIAILRDGASNTLLFGENIGGHLGHDDGQDFVFSWSGCGQAATSWGFGDDWYQWTSRHPGVVQFCLADGSVRAIPETINQDVFQAASGMADGEIAPID